MWIGGIIVGLNLIVWLVGRFATDGGTHGPDGSSYVTTQKGTAAVEGVLRRLGYATAQVRTSLDEADLSPDGTLLLVDVGEAQYSAAELNAVDSFVRAGGRLLVVGRATMPAGLFADPPSWRSAGDSRTVDDGTGTQITLSGFGSLEITAEDEPLFVSDRGLVIGARRAHGDGVFLWLADSHPFHNEGIGRPGMAQAVMAMIDPYGPVMFDEFRHGFTEGGGVWSVIPPNVRTTLLLLGIAAVIGLIAYARRLGPPYDTERRMAPGREIYLDSLAGIVARSGDRTEVLAILRDEARRRLEERSAGGDLRQVGRAAGIDPADLDAILDERNTDETLVAVDRAIATLSRREEAEQPGGS